MLNPAIPITALEGEERKASSLLLYAEKDYIDNRRARCILGVSPPALSRLVGLGYIRWTNYGKASWKRIHYPSVVNYCNYLREKHHIPDRRSPLQLPYLRYRDHELLPFPWADTVSAQEAARALGFEKVDSVVMRIEAGCFEAYQIMPNSNWRVSRTSLMLFIECSDHAVQSLPIFPHF